MLRNSFIILIFSVFSLFANDVVEEQENGFINWSEGTATAIGLGYSKKAYNKTIAMQKAKRAAKIDAMRNLLEIIQSVRIDSTTTIGDKFLENDEVKTKINGYVRNILDVKYTELEENTVEAKVRIKLDRSLYGSLIDSDDSTLNPEIFTGKKATGVIVDARKVDFMPSLSPKLLQEFEGVIYPANIVKRDNISNRFIAIYLKNMDDAKKHQIVGEFPIVVEAKKTNETKKDQIVLDSKNSSKIKNEVLLDALKEARVIIVIK